MNHRSFILAIFIFSPVFLLGQVKINELLPANYNGITDEDNEFSDWIELYNPHDAAINLSGYTISDNISLPAKWTFPSVEIQAKSHLLLFASGKNRTLPPLTYTTIINRGDDWQYYIPTSNIGDAWKSSGFSASAWSTGPSGFGYGDDDDNTIIPKCKSLFIRKEFQVSDAAKIKKMYLHLDYDDGFVAYINGIEIGRGSIGEDGLPVPYNASAIEHEAKIYKNGLPELFEIPNPESLLQNGTNVIAIQIHNTDASSSDMTAIPFLTLGSTTAGTGHSVHPYFNINQNQLHTNFKLNKDGDTVYLYNQAQVLQDFVIMKAVAMDISYGRQPDGAETFKYFGSPSPLLTNNNQAGSLTQTTDNVIFSSIGGTHLGGLTLTLSSPVVTDKLYFTTDGSVPSEASQLYAAPIVISSDGVVKARIYRTDALPGPVTTHTYITSKQHKFPITCLSTDPSNLWDEQTGIYILGANASTKKPYYGANYWQDWEKPAHFEVLNTNGEKVIDQGVGVKIFGGYSRTHDQKSMSVFARSKYGSGNIKYRFFDDKTIDKFESLVLRNGGTDGSYCIFRDGLFTGFARGMDLDRMAFKPSAHYLNGQYWGILNIREKVNEHFLADNHKFNTKDLNLLGYDGSDIMMGSNDDYEQLLMFAESNDLQNAANYQQIMNRMDVDNYIQYQLTQIYISNRDWPGNNIKFWRINTPDSKWRWILFDTDYSFGIYHWNDYEYNSLAAAMDDSQTTWPNPAWSTLLFRQLLTSTNFRNNFITQYCDHLNTTFQPTRIEFQIDSLRNLYEGEIQDHWTRWNGSYTTWLSEVERLKNFANLRPNNALNHLINAFNLGAQYNIQVSVNDGAQGQVKLNSLLLNGDTFTGKYFQNIPITLKALPKPGYKFVGWQGAINSTSSTITYNMAGAASFTAVFEKASDAELKMVVVNEINYKSASTFDTEDWIELANNGPATIDLSGWKLTDLGKEPVYYFSQGTVLYPGEFIVACSSLRNFRNHRPTTKNSEGNFEFGLSSESKGDKVRLYNAASVLIDAVDYFTTSPWPVIANELGATLELKAPSLDNTLHQNWVVNPGKGTPGKPNGSQLSTGTTKPVQQTELSLNCFPNPFKTNTTIEFSVSEAGNYQMDVWDMNGRIVAKLINQSLNPDTYYKTWDGTTSNGQPLGMGIYFIRLTSEKQSKTIKVIKNGK
jgi:hypothetical protein